MTDKKDLATEVKNALHGEVLGPEDEGYEPRKKGVAPDDAEEFEFRNRNPQWFGSKNYSQYAQQNYYQNPNNSRMGNMYSQGFYIPQNQYGNPQYQYQYQSNIFGCLLHISGLFPCKSCGRY